MLEVKIWVNQLKMEKLLSTQLISVAETFANSCNVSIVEFQLDEEKKQVLQFSFVTTTIEIIVKIEINVKSRSLMPRCGFYEWNSGNNLDFLWQLSRAYRIKVKIFN